MADEFRRPDRHRHFHDLLPAWDFASTLLISDTTREAALRCYTTGVKWALSYFLSCRKRQDHIEVIEQLTCHLSGLQTLSEHVTIATTRTVAWLPKSTTRQLQ